MSLLFSTAAGLPAGAPEGRAPLPATRRPVMVALLAAGLAWGAACAPAVKRDLSQVPAGQVGFDDLCGLQTYFDDIESRRESAPTLVDSTEFEGQRGGHALRTGRTRFAFQGRSQVRQLRRVLEDNWTRIPESMAAATRIDLEVYWSERDGLRRVASGKDALVIAGDDDVALPYHVCLSELLYGAPLYHQRREVMQLPALPPVVAATEAGAVAAPAASEPAPAASRADGLPKAPASGGAGAPARPERAGEPRPAGGSAAPAGVAAHPLLAPAPPAGGAVTTTAAPAPGAANQTASGR